MGKYVHDRLHRPHSVLLAPNLHFRPLLPPIVVAIELFSTMLMVELAFTIVVSHIEIEECWR